MSTSLPDEVSVVGLALNMMRGDLEGASVIIDEHNPVLLLSAAMGWWLGIGVREHGREELERRLAAFLADAARRRSGDPPA